MMGTRVVGNSNTTGLVTSELISAEENAAVMLTFKGTNRSKTVGRNGPAIIYSHSTTDFVCRQRIRFDLEKGFVAEPCQVTTKPNVVIDRVDSTRPGPLGKIVQRVAWRKIGTLRNQIDQMAAQDVERKVKESFEASVNVELAQLNKHLDMANRLAGVAKLIGKTANLRCTLSSTDNYLQVVCSSADRAATLPDESSVSSPVEVWIHASLINEGVSAALSTLTLVNRDTASAIFSGFLHIPTPKSQKSAEPLKSLLVATTDEWVVLTVAAKERQEQEDVPLLTQRPTDPERVAIIP
jgi:hypothetical protein